MHLAVVARAGGDDGRERRRPLGVDGSVAGRIAASSSGLVIPELPEGDATVREELDGARSVVGAPLRAGSRLIGVIHAAARTPDRFAEADLELLRLVADRAALAIDRERVSEAERQARTHAEAASRAKDEFLATLSHDLRTPLNSMLGWVKMLRGGRLDSATQRRALEVLERNVYTQNQLISDLLDASRIVTGKLALDTRSVDLAAIIEGVVETVRPAAEAKRIALSVTLDPGLGQIWGDPDRLQQVVWNLLSNAVKFTPEEGKVEVRLEHQQDRARITVVDTGRAIPPEAVAMLFERLPTSAGGVPRAYAGLGLGLAIVRHLIELHGGAVEATSAPNGNGVVVRVDLPIVRPMEQRPALPEVGRDLPEPDETAELLRGIRVLVVDDDADTCDLLRMVLGRHGASVRTAASAGEARDALARAWPDVLVCDIAMPGESGVALIHEIRMRPIDEGGALPAIALTAFARPEDRHETIAAGFHEHLSKPVEPGTLVEVVATLVGRRA
jgi:signal transduction histidine kinase/ActR/RegA family two-component response regulator